MDKIEIEKTIKDNQQTLNKFNVYKLGLFGSYVNNKQKSKSDIDFLVEFSKTPTLFEFYDFKKKMENLFAKKIDLCTINALKPAIKESILKEVSWF